MGPVGFNILEKLNTNNKLKQIDIKIENKDEKNNNGNDELVLQQQIQNGVLKEELKDTKAKLEQLIGQVKELLKNAKCDNKNKPQFVQICQILNLSPQTTKRLINNINKKGINF